MPPDPQKPSTPTSIPLRDLQRPPDSGDLGDGARGHNRGRSLLSGRPLSGGQHGYGPRYERLGETSPSPTDRTNYRQGLPPLRVQAPTPNPYEEIQTPVSPVGNPADFQAAMGFAGLLVPDISLSQAPRTRASAYGSGDFDGPSPYGDDGRNSRGESRDYDHSYFASESFSPESDRVPLNNPDHLQPISGAYQPTTPDGQRHDRSSFRTVSFSSPGRSARLGDDLHHDGAGASPQSGRSRNHSYGVSLTPTAQPGSRLPSTSTAFSRAGSIVRAMSQRVVNLSGEAELIEESARREASRGSRRASRPPRASRTQSSEEEHTGWSDISSLDEESEPRIFRKKDPLGAGPNYQEQLPTAPVEKIALRFFGKGKKQTEPTWEPEKPPNPLKGRSLGIFSAESIVRNKLCDVLVYPVTEPLILLLIVVQTVLLAVDASKNVYLPGNERSTKWGSKPIDYALLALFVLFTMELIARIIVSGLIINAPEYGNGKKRSVKAAITEKYRAVFAPQRQSSLRAPQRTETSFSTPDILRSFTAKQGEGVRTVEQAQRLQLARRAFLRHSFNRLDFLAVFAFWTAFVLSLTGTEDKYHIYIFRMISCLRILRLLALTHGTAVRCLVNAFST